MPYRDISNPAVTQREHRSVLKRLKRTKESAINERTIFGAIIEQRALVEKAGKDTAAARRHREKTNSYKKLSKENRLRSITEPLGEEPANLVVPYTVEVWE